VRLDGAHAHEKLRGELAIGPAGVHEAEEPFFGWVSVVSERARRNVDAVMTARPSACARAPEGADVQQRRFIAVFWLCD
jgi:hypothetical protein